MSGLPLMVPADDGGYVDYDDHVVEVERLQARLDACASLLEAPTREGVIAEALAEVERLQARVTQLTEAGLADQARADAWRDRFQAQKRIAKKLLARERELEAALHRISLGSQNSATTKEYLGREARAALEMGET